MLLSELDALVPPILSEAGEMSHVLLYVVHDDGTSALAKDDGGASRIDLTADAIAAEGLATLDELETDPSPAERVVRGALAWVEQRMRELTPAGRVRTFRIRVARLKGSGWILNKTIVLDRTDEHEDSGTPPGHLEQPPVESPLDRMTAGFERWTTALQAFDRYLDGKLRRVMDSFERQEGFYTAREARMTEENAQLRRDNGRLLEAMLSARVSEAEAAERKAVAAATAAERAAKGGERDIAGEGLDMFKDLVATLMAGSEIPAELASAVKSNPKLIEALKGEKFQKFLKDPAAADMLSAAVESLMDDTPNPAT